MPRIRSTAAKLAIGIVALSVICRIPGVLEWIALAPAMVIGRFAVWQPVTYSLVAVDVFGVLFGAFMTWSIGGALERVWGPRRMLIFALGTTALAGALTVALSLVLPTLRIGLFPGASVLTIVLWVAYGLHIGRGATNFWGIPLTGNVLALIGIAFVVLNLIFSQWVAVPSFLGVLLTVAYLRGANPRLLWLRFQSWRFQRQLRSRSRHLRVIGGKDAGSSRGSDRFLH